ncbi:MAG: hypothetical protein EZS28_015594, partial [Streblomastix strix]
MFREGKVLCPFCPSSRWSDEILEGVQHYNITRVEIIVDYPTNLDITALTVVDPNNPNQPVFHFVRWKHGAKPRLHKIEDNNENKDIITYRVKLTTETGIIQIIEYIQYDQRNTLSVPFFAALESVIPNVPESALRGAFDLIQRSNNDELLKFALTYKDSAVTRYSLDILAQRGIQLFAIASKFKDLNITPDDPRSDAAITALVLFKGGIKRRQTQIKIKEQRRFKQLFTGKRHSNGFLCDRKNIFGDQVVPDRLLLDAAQQLSFIREGKFNPANVEELLRIGHI